MLFDFDAILKPSCLVMDFWPVRKAWPAIP